MTKNPVNRRLKQRITDITKGEIKTALSKHALTHGHTFHFDNFTILATEKKNYEKTNDLVSTVTIFATGITYKTCLQLELKTVNESYSPFYFVLQIVYESAMMALFTIEIAGSAEGSPSLC